MMAVDGLGVFARQQGERAGLTPAVSLGLFIQAGDFQPAPTGKVMLKIDGQVGSHSAAFAGLAVASSTTVKQARTGQGGLLVDVGQGSHTVSAQFGRAAANVAFKLAYRLAGDVDGSFGVTAADLDLIRTGMRTPSVLPRLQLANADVDGNGSIDARDLQLATVNLGASTTVRPLGLVAGIDAATPSNQGVVRLPSGRISATTAAGATVVFANAATGERVQRTAGKDGETSADVQLRSAAENRIAVMAQDTFGQRAFRAVPVHQRPTPVVIVPGWATSMPRSLYDIPDFLMRLGYPAEKLVATNLIYGDLRHSLAAAGYAQDKDQFVVPYDWRLPLAPDDGVRDGRLAAVTAEAILRPQPTSALGYLGTFLARLVEQDPSIVKVDMLGYSFGGLMTRAYVQSSAYGASFTAGGRTLALPEVDKLILLATPSQGSAISYNFWNNDTSSFAISLLVDEINIVRTVLAPVYEEIVQRGRAVTGPNGIIDRAAITDPVTGRPDPRAFLQRYFASLRDMLPTYEFLYDTAGRLTTINDSPSANRILLDLNATSSPGVNPWTVHVGQAIAAFGVHPREWLWNRAVLTETFVREVVGDGRTGSIWPFQSARRVTPAKGAVYLVKQSLDGGDDMVPEVSLVATYANDPTITIRRWGNGAPPTGRSWTPTVSSVQHASVLRNPDVLAFVRSRLAPTATR